MVYIALEDNDFQEAGEVEMSSSANEEGRPIQEDVTEPSKVSSSMAEGGSPSTLAASTRSQTVTITPVIVSSQLQHFVPPKPANPNSSISSRILPLDFRAPPPSTKANVSPLSTARTHQMTESDARGAFPNNMAYKGSMQGTKLHTGPTQNLSVWLPGAIGCKDKLCMEYLSYEDISHFHRMTMMTKTKPDMNNPQCHFMDGRGRDPVGLVSVPGSGNTWVRGLLERATGICTGSIYTDEPVRMAGFLGEYIRSGRVIVVKDHTSDFQWKGEILESRNAEDALFDSIIFLIRNPFDTFVAERHRVATLHQIGSYWPKPPGEIDNSHTHLVEKSYFGKCHTCGRNNCIGIPSCLLKVGSM